MDRLDALAGRNTSTRRCRTWLAGKYRLARRLGTGGTGAVYLAREIRLERDVAIKILGEVSVSRLMGLKPEAWAMATVTHPGLAQIYGIETFRGRSFLVVEFLAGGTLADQLVRGPIPVSRAVSIVIVLADALAALHESGYLHGDVKPSNIGFTSKGSPKLLDFGLARETDDDSLAGGTLRYLSPEVLSGHAAREPDDIWSLCVVLYEMVSGEHPFAANGNDEVADRIVRQRLVRPAGSSEPSKVILIRGIDAHCAEVGAPGKCARVRGRSSSSSRQRVESHFFQSACPVSVSCTSLVSNGVFFANCWRSHLTKLAAWTRTVYKIIGTRDSDMNHSTGRMSRMVSLALHGSGILFLLALALLPRPAQAQRIGPLVPDNQQQSKASSAEREEALRPPSLQLNLPSPAEVALPPLGPDDLQRLQPQRGRPPVIGVHRRLPQGVLKLSFSGGGVKSTAEGAWRTTEDGRLWRLKLTSPSARALRVHFRDFAIGSGRVWLHSEDGQTVGPYSGSGLYGDGDFWSGIVFGDSLTIEYLPDPAASGEAVPFRIVEISHIWGDVLGDGAQDGAQWPKAAREGLGPIGSVQAVARLHRPCGGNAVEEGAADKVGKGLTVGRVGRKPCNRR